MFAVAMVHTFGWNNDDPPVAHAALCDDPLAIGARSRPDLSVCLVPAEMTQPDYVATLNTARFAIDRTS